MFSEFFQLTPLPDNHIVGKYSLHLVILSYLVATGASYVALDIANRVRDIATSNYSKLWWILGGSFAMGAGIWSMHFIGMLAFIMPMSMAYDPFLTGLSMVIAIFSSAIAFSLLQTKTITLTALIFGGVILGLSIASMHYVGMAAVLGMDIRYLPGFFALSILVAIIASEAALALAIKSSQVTLKSRTRLKICSAFVMGAAISGMHYIGMAAAVFLPSAEHVHVTNQVDPNMLAISVAVVTIFILGIAVVLSSFQAMLNLRSIEVAHKAGMAEVASNVLHNVGNVLNGVNVSTSLVMDHLKNINLKNLSDLNHLIRENKDNLGDFIENDPQGSMIPSFLNKMSDYWNSELQLAKDELHQLLNKVQHIKTIIARQQQLSGVINYKEQICIQTVIKEAISFVGIDFERHNIILTEDYTKLDPVCIDKSKLTQILINLISNAKEALLESSSTHKNILISTGLIDQRSFFIKVKDNGVGIKENDQTRIFSHGFTTKHKGHGFGLHASAIAANEMQGSLTVFSEGHGKGAVFQLVLPYITAKNEDSSEK